MDLKCDCRPQGWSLQKEDEIGASSHGRNGCSMGHGIPYVRGMGWVSHEVQLSLTRPGQGLGLLLDPEALVSGAQ